MSVEHAWSVLCDRTIVDKDTNNISLDVIESIQAVGAAQAQPPSVLVPTNLRLVSLWYRTTDVEPAATMRVTFLAPSGQRSVTSTLSFS